MADAASTGLVVDVAVLIYLCGVIPNRRNWTKYFSHCISRHVVKDGRYGYKRSIVYVELGMKVDWLALWNELYKPQTMSSSKSPSALFILMAD